MLELNNISYQYKGNEEKTLDQINYTFRPGVFYTILGNSGSGKTTLLSLMAGLDTPTGGQVLFNGKDIRQTGYAHHRRKNIALVFQNYNLLDYLTPLENIQLVNPKANKQLLLELGLEEEMLSRNILRLSGGQQQRVAIARALVAETPTILLDEPTGNLDYAIANEITLRLKEFAKKEKCCVIMVTHSREIAKMADQSLRLTGDSLEEENVC
ncbi:ATP-binding cassette domain-containing protein [Streptococcus hongkongensis]|nr:multidrug ABC transporter ATP-binding protein [Streptococcus uberis]